MPLIAVTDIMDKERQDKARQENSSSAVEPIGGTDESHTSDPDSKQTRKDDGPAPVFHSQLSKKLERLSATERVTGSPHPEHHVEDITKAQTSAFDASAQQDSTGSDLTGTQLPHRPKAHSHTRENTSIDEPDVLLG
ncbi:hypothetical protein Plec18167_005145 [Paecilomyces lecythidis]|uniref:Uncharacterized protein n=1 Tax=Paecilomyces lecythidis TaxID=3004212 RepID=A0ABR3XL87_9EURO